MSVASSSDRSKHSTAHKVQGALRGPLGRLRTTPPTLYREGNRAEYPIIHLNAPDINAKSKFPENLFFTTKYAKNTFSKKKTPKKLTLRAPPKGIPYGHLYQSFYSNNLGRQLAYISYLYVS